MAVRQTGRRVRDEAPRRGAERKHTAPAVRPSRRGKREALAPSERRRLIQLVACGGVFVLLVAVKLLLPDRLAQVNGRLTGMLEQNMDVRAVFSAVGRAVSGEADVDVALQDVYQAVFRPQELSPAVEAAAAPAGEEVDLLPPDVMAPLRSFRKIRRRPMPPTTRRPPPWPMSSIRRRTCRRMSAWSSPCWALTTAPR